MRRASERAREKKERERERERGGGEGERGRKRKRDRDREKGGSWVKKYRASKRHGVEGDFTGLYFTPKLKLV